MDGEVADVMKVAIIGSRGIPNYYGGFEECAENLALFLKRMNNDVYVYSTKSHLYKNDTWKGINIIHIDNFVGLPGIGSVLYDFLCILDASHRRFDVVIQLGYSPSGLFSLILKKARVPTITNMAGMEWRRSKWGPLAKTIIRASERLAVRYSDIVVSDNVGIKQYIDNKYGISSAYIPYGAIIPSKFDERLLRRYGVQKGRYILVIARLQPDNNVEMIVNGYLKSHIVSNPLIIIGALDSKYARRLRIKYLANQDVQFVGANYDKDELMALRKYSFIYFHGHSAGGTNPSLLEAMAAEARIAAFDNIFNRTVLDDHALFFADEDDVARIVLNIDKVYDDSWTSSNKLKISTEYQWDKVGAQYYKSALSLVREKIE
jgi:glycosyltransferase involved in cell wall biosynthesis